MAKHEVNKGARLYHSLVAMLMLLAGFGLFGIGIWLQVTNNAGPLDLDYAGDNVFRVALRFPIASIIAGGFLIIAAIAGLFALARNCVGGVFRGVYILMAIVVLGVLLAACVTSSLIVDRDDSEAVRDFLEDAWERTVTGDKDSQIAICEIENFYGCRGFDNNDCDICVLGSEALCESSRRCAKCDVPTNPAIGCYGEIIDSVRDVFLPIAIASAVLSAIVLIDLFVTCAL